MSDQRSLAHVLGRVALVEARVRRAVGRRQQDDPAPDDPFRGLYLSDEAARRLLDDQRGVPGPDTADQERSAAVEADADTAQAAGADLRLRRLARAFGLVPLDVELLLVALAPDLDSRLEQLYGYLNDDVTRRRPTAGLALLLCGVAATSAAARGRLAADAPLVAHGLLAVEDAERPFLGRTLRVPDRVCAHLLGGDAPDPRLLDVLAAEPPDVDLDASALSAALGAGVRLVHVRERPGGAGRSLAAAALRLQGRAVVVVDLAQLAADPDPAACFAAASREALLVDAGIVAAAVEDVSGEHRQLLRLLSRSPAPALLVGTGSWDPAWSDRSPLLVDAPLLGSSARAALWRRALDAAQSGHRPEQATQAYLLSPDGVVRAAASARQQSLLDGGVISDEHLRAGARAQNAGGLERLARRLEPAVGWADLVLPGATRQALSEVALRAKHREQVLGQWRMRPGGGRGRGVTALFAGDSGTGKTMSAEVVAGELGLDLYTVDLATVVDKYVGETEKNLERIFDEAGGVNGVLFFDEADAVFGKRSEVRDAHDRYANIESAYLLQRMETFDGLAVLATNLRANIDEAFTRRLDVVVDFPLPDADLRRGIWDRCLGTQLVRSVEIDLDFCARAFRLSGGSIRSVAVTAAYLAADDGGVLRMDHLVAAVQREYRKLGRLCLESEFGPYLPLVR